MTSHHEPAKVLKIGDFDYFQNPKITSLKNSQNHRFSELFGSIHFLRKKCIKKPPLLGREDCLPPSHLGGEIFDSLCRRGQVSSPLASLGFRGANPRRLYRRRSLGWGDFPAAWGSRWPLFLYRGVRRRPVLLGHDGGWPFACTRWDFGVIAHPLRSRRASLQRLGFGFPLPLCLYYSTDRATCQDFFYFFLDFFLFPLGLF